MTIEVAADQLKALVQRVERVESEIAELNADKSEIYKEARSLGFDVKAIKKVVSKRKLEDHDRAEQDMLFETYWDAVHGTGLVHAHARENITKSAATPGADATAPVSSQTAVAPGGAVAHGGSSANQPVTANEMDRSTKSLIATRSGEAENARKASPITADGSVTHAGAGESPATHPSHPIEECDHKGPLAVMSWGACCSKCGEPHPFDESINQHGRSAA